eukprot:3516967-Amphidinium_carterae.1
MHNSNRQFREKFEMEALEYQQEVNKNTGQQVQAKLKQEVSKIEAEMTNPGDPWAYFLDCGLKCP